MNIFQALILGVVEGITEFLPISSTAHLLLAGQFLEVADQTFLTSFSIFIQVGAICAVVWLYRRELLTSKLLWKQLLVAFVPTAVIGLIFYPLIKSVLLIEAWVSIGALFFGGIFLIWFEKRMAPRLQFSEQVNLKQSFWVGVAQAVAVIPGVSRAGATIVGGMLAGISRSEIVKFSFLLAIPTMLSAAGLDMFKNYQSFSFDKIELLAIGFLTAFVVAVVVIKWLVRYVAKHNFILFGWYRIALAIILAVILL